MNNASPKISAFVAYLLPIVGWIYVLFFQRKSQFALFHTRQAVGLFLFLVAAFGAWVVIGYVLAWVPFGFVASMALFTVVITAFIYGIVAWIIGMVNALQGKVALLPIFGKMANNLPF